jgi:hypothetical protein
VKIDLATLEWIRRLGPDPSVSEVTALKAIRRGTDDPRDHRLIDAIIRPAEARFACARDIGAMRRRLAVVEECLSEQGSARETTLVEIEIASMRDALVAAYWPMTNAEATRRAQRSVRERRRSERADLEREREDIRRRIDKRQRVRGLRTDEGRAKDEEAELLRHQFLTESFEPLYTLE